VRPFVKGNWPIMNGVKVGFVKHGDAKPYLEENTGHYCHFCEMPLQNVPAVEHIKHQINHPNLVCHWDNLLLICTYCNSRKTKSKIKTYNYYWPHQHNTFYVFDYEILNIMSRGIPAISTRLTDPVLKIKAERTINLYGLHQTTNSSGGIDRRLSFRLIAISQALECKKEYDANPRQITEQAILRTARAAGFWSVWFTIFQNDSAVLTELLQFQGTHVASFDTATYNPIPRNPTNIDDPI
jgi:hypothetical protein